MPFDSSSLQKTLEKLRRLAVGRKLSFHIRPAGIEDREAILELIEEARKWLPTVGTSQWSKDWTDDDGLNRSERVERSLEDGTTWMVYVPFRGAEIPLATVTIDKDIDSKVWSDVRGRSHGNAYLSRLVTARDFAGLDIGSAVIDWACRYAAEELGARRMRIDVWTDNDRLHKYYLKHGFRRRGYCPDETYPARARFERRISSRTGTWTLSRVSLVQVQPSHSSA